MPRSIFHLKLLRDDASDHRRVPDPGSKAALQRSVVDDFPQSQLLLVIQERGTTGPLTFQQRFVAKGFIVAQPLRHFRTGSVQHGRNLSATASVMVEQHRMQPFRYPISSVGLGLLSPTFQPPAGLEVQAQDSSTHAGNLAHTKRRVNPYVPLFMSQSVCRPTDRSSLGPTFSHVISVYRIHPPIPHLSENAKSGFQPLSARPRQIGYPAKVTREKSDSPFKVNKPTPPSVKSSPYAHSSTLWPATASRACVPTVVNVNWEARPASTA